ncbi:replication/maintenance protein RepL [Pseudomonas putida]|uniref:replication/maintenance protein RepL n=1 Tax=Pseudomonas putida TaxID=303 RepID=UPI00236698D0|nr:replication/maintenance protein RepL [Pseudomonas putida]MDD2049691.1 replication/maintenance protein RepL [Pseudomonas putida]
MKLDATTPITADTPKPLSIDGLIIDTCTGEILGHDDTPSALAGPAKYKCELGKCRSVDDFEDHLSFVDRRKLPPHALHSLRSEVDDAHGEWRRTGIDCRITIPQLRLLEQLHGLTLYRNIIITTQADLAKSLGTAESNLMKKLRVLTDSHILRVLTSRDGSMRKGEIKLSVNPRLVFRGDDYTRDRYIKNWYHPTGYFNTGTTELSQESDSLTKAA